MTKRTIFILAAIWITTLAAVAMASAETLRFIPLPMQDRETVLKQFRPMTAYLEQRLGATIVYDYCDNYADVLERFRQSKVDLAYLGPLPYVRLRTVFDGAEPLVHFKEASGEARYTCSLVTFVDTGFDPGSSRDRQIALTQPLSTCGYLSTGGLMRNHGGSLADNLYRYLGKHDAVALAVVRGEFDAGGLKSAIARKYTHMGLKIVAKTPPLPGFALVGNRHTLDPTMMDRIRQELIVLDPKGKDESRLSAWGDNIRHGAVTASDADYTIVRELLGKTQIPQEGNF
ncbi:PhnD/SsuA/transferrin family substrate-binding protein [Desulfosarcina ovata]|uniref:ABC transporter substrate-binding protein n=1 Tax=Desulfosarcina ovata subsp. ovata TaxID=2752305 RepID=A0A5K8AEK1_9BACT|nr:PhnD/SsuA/transferrin family substrate-binding protein [Desulfosarcina ovata]BBO91062.1 ABC transporter substrate-binding protein [Desulfosarcina ovata subsp. ovata]